MTGVDRGVGSGPEGVDKWTDEEGVKYRGRVVGRGSRADAFADPAEGIGNGTDRDPEAVADAEVDAVRVVVEEVEGSGGT